MNNFNEIEDDDLDIDSTDEVMPFDIDGLDDVSQESGSLFKQNFLQKIKIHYTPKVIKTPEDDDLDIDSADEVMPFDIDGLDDVSQESGSLFSSKNKKSFFVSKPDLNKVQDTSKNDEKVMDLNEAFATKFADESDINNQSENSEIDFEAELLNTLQSNNTNDKLEVNNESKSFEKVSTQEKPLVLDKETVSIPYLSAVLQILRNAKEPIYATQNKSLSSLNFSALERHLKQSDSYSKKIIEEEINARISSLNEDISNEIFKRKPEVQENIEATVDTLKGRHSAKLGKQLFQSTWSKGSSKNRIKKIRDSVSEMARFGKWASLNSAEKLKRFFDKGSKGYSIGKSQSPRPMFSLAHMIGVATVTTAYFGGLVLVNDFAKENPNAYSNLKQATLDFAENSLDAINNVTHRPLEEVSYNSNNYLTEESSSDLQVPSSQFVTKAYEHLQSINPNLSMDEWMPAVADFHNLLQVCYGNSQDFCKMTISPDRDNTIAFGESNSANNIILDATTGTFEIYNQNGEISYTETLDLADRKEIGWF
jgi:hypothetical protein